LHGYDATLVTFVNTLVSRALAAFLVRITQLGGRIVYASKVRVIVSTPKHDAGEARQFATYLLSALREAPLIRHMGPHLRRMWSVIAIQDVLNHIGAYIAAPSGDGGASDDGGATATADGAAAAAQGTLGSFGSFSDLAMTSTQNGGQKLQLHLQLPALQALPTVAARATQRAIDLLQHVEQAKRAAADLVLSDATTTLATRPDRLKTAMRRFLDRSLSEAMQPQLISDVNDIIVDDALRASLSGGATAARALAATFAAVVCTLMQRVDEQSLVPRRTLNNCLRLCGFSPFSTNFAAHLWYSGGETQRVAVLRFMCGTCNTEVVLDLTQPKPPLAGGVTGDQPSQAAAAAAKAATHWTCASCRHALSTAAIEERCVRVVRSWVAKFNDQDFACVRCRQPSSALLSLTCACGGVLAPRLTRTDVLARLARFITVARVHNLACLAETVDEAFADLAGTTN
jgi:hypothetical protein